MRKKTTWLVLGAVGLMLYLQSQQNAAATAGAVSGAAAGAATGTVVSGLGLLAALILL